MTFADRLIHRAERRAPDFVIGGHDRPYLRRWWLTPWRSFSERAKHSDSRITRFLGRCTELLPNAYLHEFLRSDDDRALHDHPWSSVSIILRGGYLEHTPEAVYIRLAGDWITRRAKQLHRVELNGGPCWTLFLTGPRVREWGFMCGDRWVHWKQFTAADDPGAVGKGCDA